MSSMKSSALSENTKIASLSQDMVRMMKNTSESLPQSGRNEVIDNFTKKLTRSGYTYQQTKNIIEAGLKGYEAALERARTGKRKLHCNAKEGASKRYRKKLMAKSQWFKDKKTTTEAKDEKHAGPCLQTAPGGGGLPNQAGKKSDKTKEKKDIGKNQKPTTTVLFVPQTPGGELARRLRAAENELSALGCGKVKIVEKGGRTLRQTLVRSNPWDGGLCGRKDCLPCKNGEENSRCSKRNIVYETQCQECKKNGKKKVYIGESSRTAHERGLEH